MPGRYQNLLSKDAYIRANCLSRLFFTWLNGLLRLGYKRPLTDDDLLLLSDDYKTQDLVEDLAELWDREVVQAKKLGKKPKLWKAMIKLFSPLDYTIPLILNLTSIGMEYVVTIAIWFYLNLLQSSSNALTTYGAAAVIVIGVASLMRVFCFHHYGYKASILSVKLKSAVLGFIHKKILESKRCDLAGFTKGQILNYVSNDNKRIETLVFGMYETIGIPFIQAAVILSLIFLVGWQSLSGLSLMVFLLFLIVYAAKTFARIREKQAKVTDERLAVMNEIIRGIRAVKMYAWEWNYNDVVSRIRREEVKLIRQKTLPYSIIWSLRFSIAPTATLISICSLVYFEITISAISIFSMAIIFGSCVNCLSNNAGYNFRVVRDAKVSIDRIEMFLLETCKEEGYNLESDVIEEKETIEEPKEPSFLFSNEKAKAEQKTLITDKTQPSVILEKVSAAWKREQPNILHQISLSVSSNQLLMVTGSVGSGKSSLLMAILGEIPTTEGTIKTHGRIAYVSQTPWIFSGTIRDNILFGKPLDTIRYDRILEMCDLHKDIESFPYGDLSLIGQRGVGLSGGQRARVSLARAIYSDADIYLLDDPLSAVDARVGQHIFDKCICGELLSSRIRILVTHQVQHLHRADKIIILQGGSAIAHGTHFDLTTNEGMFESIQKQKTQSDSIFNEGYSDLGVIEDAEERDLQEEEEDRSFGTVSWRVYWQFFRIGLPTFLIGCLVLFSTAVQASIILPSWWMSRIAHMSLQEQKNIFALGIFGGLSASSFVLSVARNLFILFAILHSTRKLHDKMTLAVIKSPVLFFDTNPAGRIMNRFSKDIGAMDDLLPMQFIYAISIFLNLIGVVVLAAIVKFWIVLGMVPLGFIFIYNTLYFLKTYREVKRMEAIRCSPVYDHLAETLSGLEIIRTSNMEENCCNKMFSLQDYYTQAFFLVLSTARWFAMYLDLMFALFLTAVAVVGLVAIEDHALAGMLLTLVMSLFSITPFGLKMASEVESQMTSVERVMTYCQLSSEPGYSRQDKPPEDWPNQGALSLKNVSLVYLEGGPRVLKDVNFDVQPKEKVGIVGRTGAGKSSLVAALFRMPDPQGQVLIDGVDLGTIDIQAVRRSMAVITQNPVLFAGSLKKNLDPFDRFTDEDIWLALEQVQLKNKMEKLPHQLKYCVGEGGSGFSVGERQLLCLARALLQKCKIIVLDEATANVDYKTDQLIQQVIRQQFTNCTVLTIAHRLNTIMDYDKVVVLDQGHVVESGSPSILNSLVNEIGLTIS